MPLPDILSMAGSQHRFVDGVQVAAGQQQAHGEQDNCHDDASPLSKTGVVVQCLKVNGEE